MLGFGGFEETAETADDLDEIDDSLFGGTDVLEEVNLNFNSQSYLS